MMLLTIIVINKFTCFILTPLLFYFNSFTFYYYRVNYFEQLHYFLIIPKTSFKLNRPNLKDQKEKNQIKNRSTGEKTKVKR